MSIKKWTVVGVIVIALACITTGKPEVGAVAIAGLIGFLKDDTE